LGLNVVAFDGALAHRAALLRAATRSAGLSLGDHACLALAAHHQATVLTADRNWAHLPPGLQIVVIR
jgi:PIN domain nuclease of toxin-antitoxin system